MTKEEYEKIKELLKELEEEFKETLNKLIEVIEND
jgi:hypothetical protein|tara:strand:+ start:89 stop:193 length:105 start_codon:yes stop_codon:yes gene_type:complete